MPNNSIRLTLILGSLAVCGVLLFQSFWLIETWSIKNDEFDSIVIKSLREVAVKIADINQTELPKSNLIQKRSSSYAVNVNSAIDANILEDFLVRTFDEASLNTAFEYAVYDCVNNELEYKNYCNLNAGQESYERTDNLPTFDHLIYYFVISFPKRSSYLINDLRTNIMFSIISVFAVLLFMYAIWVILKQQKATDLQKDFINNMTHEFKTPISSIKIASDVIINNEDVKSDARISQYAAIIKDQNDRLNNQVEKVLNIARLEKDKFKLNLESIDLVEFVKKIMSLEKLKFDETNGFLSFSTNEEAVLIKADKLHLTNVLSNILDNAVKYCDKKPDVLFELTTNNKKVFLSIKDNGIGIEKDNQKKLFNKFYRVSTGNVHNVKGFGLGLYYVKNICDAHGWKIDVKSKIGEGTQFIIEMEKEKN
ncbi:MAG: HAMP domain-containing histidine kinase [Saprospiraceae bacterium]|nr:HAMP domain-containing histidine kinase [Bacteroidia bacterium]NNE16760.1 HAMP domain-containing histidine kinase [Saprospiraceae bacterium]NNL92325.1 HAMP domain-containing histidine kinase [Saprospiraceae bacterium]